MIEVILSLQLSTHTLCMTELETNLTLQCTDQVVVGKTSTPTPKGTYEIQSIYKGNFHLNTLSNGLQIAIHPYIDQRTSGYYSLGCIRISPKLQQELLLKYYFNQILIY